MMMTGDSLDDDNDYDLMMIILTSDDGFDDDFAGKTKGGPKAAFPSEPLVRIDAPAEGDFKMRSIQVGPCIR